MIENVEKRLRDVMDQCIETDRIVAECDRQAAKSRTITDLDRLEALATAASPGPWSCQHVNAGHDPEELSFEEIESKDSLISIVHDAVKNAPYIAACSPDVILKLIGRLRHLEEFAIKLRNMCEEAIDG